MGSYIQNLKIFFRAFLFFLVFGLFFSCSQTTPDIQNATYSVIYDYKNVDEKPNARLSIFLESSSDVRRYDRIKVFSEDSQFIWDFDEIITLEKENYQFAGTTSLCPPENEIIPSGTYIITCINADEKQDELKISVSYDKDFYDIKENNVPSKMQNKNGINKIAIYDEQNVMIYFGEKTDQMKTNRDIWNIYSNAKYYQDIWCDYKSNVICILSAKEITPEK